MSVMNQLFLSMKPGKKFCLLRPDKSHLQFHWLDVFCLVGKYSVFLLHRQANTLTRWSVVLNESHLLLRGGVLIEVESGDDTWNRWDFLNSSVNQLFNRKINFELLWIPVKEAESDLKSFKPLRFKYFWRNNKEKDLVKDLLHSLIFPCERSQKRCSLFALQHLMVYFFLFTWSSHCVLLGDGIKHGVSSTLW